MIDKYTGNNYKISVKNNTIIFLLALIILFSATVLYLLKLIDHNKNDAEFLIGQLKQSNNIMSDRLLLSEYRDIENERLNDRYIDRIKKRLEIYKLTKYNINLKDFIYPVENPNNCYVAVSEAEYGMRILKNWGRNFHHGIDIKMVFDGNIICPSDGVVFDIGYNEMAGNYIEIYHEIDGREYMSVYFHLSRIDALKGADVLQGERIGFVGDTGDMAKGHVHLHWAVYKKTKNGWKSINTFSNSLHGAYENREMPIYNFLRE